MSYKHPMLVEIFAELHFQPNTLLPPSFFEIVPKLKGIGLDQIELGEVVGVGLVAPAAPAPLGPGPIIHQSSSPRVRCWAGDRTKLVQLSQDQVIVNVIVNQVGPYRGWDPFKTLVAQTLSAVNDVLRGDKLDSISLNTIDRVQVPTQGFTLGTFLNCGGPRLPEWYSDSAEPCDISMGRGLVLSDGFNRQINVVVRPEADKMTINLFCVFHDRLTAPTEWDKALERMHDESNASFESLITEKMRELMGGSE